MTTILIIIFFIIGIYIGFKKYETINSFINHVKSLNDKSFF